VLAGVVMRADMVLDGFSFSSAKVGGMDATQRILELYRNLDRSDVNVILLNGCIISWYNVIDINYLFEETGIPVICVTYEDSEGLERYFRELFPGDGESRIEIYHRNGPRNPLRLNTGHMIFVRFLGVNQNDTIGILNKFTLQEQFQSL